MRSTRSARLAPIPWQEVASLQLPLFASPIRAGFPSPADDHLEQDIDLNAYLVRHPAATYLLTVAGDSMVGEGLFPGDVVVVDRSLGPQTHDVVVVELEGEFLVKCFERTNHAVRLLSANPAYAPILVTGEMEATVFGVVTFVLHRPGRRGR